jgi:peroxiredoxin
VGAAYDVVRDADDPYRAMPRRHSYLIAPNGMIEKAYDVTDAAGHAAQVIQDLVDLGAAPTGWEAPGAVTD